MIAFRPWMLAASVCFGMLVTFLGAAGVIRKNRKTFSRGIDTVYGKSICREKK